MSSAFLSFIVAPELAENIKTPKVDCYRERCQFFWQLGLYFRVQENIFSRIVRQFWIASLNVPDADTLVSGSDIFGNGGALVH